MQKLQSKTNLSFSIKMYIIAFNPTPVFAYQLFCHVYLDNKINSENIWKLPPPPHEWKQGQHDETWYILIYFGLTLHFFKFMWNELQMSFKSVKPRSNNFLCGDGSFNITFVGM